MFPYGSWRGGRVVVAVWWWYNFTFSIMLIKLFPFLPPSEWNINAGHGARTIL